MKNYVSVKEAIEILGSTRQNIHYLKKHGILKDFIKVHATCYMYSKEELLNLKSLGYGA
jgi:DNA-binding transcriptional MerR regulator